MRNEMSKDRKNYLANRDKNTKNFWLTQLSGELIKSNFPYDIHFKGRNELEIDTQAVRYKFSSGLYAKLRKESKDSLYKIHILLLTGVALLLNKYTGNKDIIVSTPIYKPDSEGNFINTVLPIRVHLDGINTFREMLAQVGKTVVEASKQQNYPIEILLEQVGMSHTEYDPSILDVAVLLENIHNPEHLHMIPPKITFSFQVKEETLEGEVKYRANLYERSTIGQVITYLERLLEQAVENLDSLLSQLELISAEEKKLVSLMFNGGVLSENETTIVELFEKQVLKTPHHIAAVGTVRNSVSGKYPGYIYLSYKALNEKANGLALSLKQKKVMPGMIIGLEADASIEMIIGILAIMKTGAACLPIPFYFDEIMKKEILKNARPTYVLTGDEIQEMEDSSEMEVKIKPSDIAYLNFTSSSNGDKMEIVLLEHRTICSVINGMAKTVYKKYGQGLGMCLVAPFFSGVAPVQIFGALLQGHRLHIPPETIRLDSLELFRFYKKFGIDISDGTPALIYELSQLEKGQYLELSVKEFFIFIDGEFLPPETVRQFFKRFKTRFPLITHIYGTTESGSVSAVQEISPGNINTGDKILFEKPMPGQTIYIVDSQNRLLPPGVTGELCIAGIGVAKGYLNNPGLMEKNYIQTPFAPDQWMVKTGDLGKWLRDGVIEISGRLDRRVVINGFFIEAEKIERLVSSHPGISAAIIFERCLYYVSDKDIPTPDLNVLFVSKFHKFLIPASFARLQNLPVTSDWKINRDVLPDNILVAEDRPAAVGNIEDQLSQIWTEILEIEKSEFDSDTEFSQIGGQSLQAIMLSAKIHKEFNVSIPIPVIFQLATIKKLASYIKEAVDTVFSPIEPAEEKEYYELSPGQKMLYLLQQVDVNSVNYNVPQVVTLEGSLDKEKLYEAFKRIVERHESFRTFFELVAEIPVQKIHREVTFEPVYYDLEGKLDELAEKKIVTGFIKPFDLAQAPLLRVELIKVSQARHILMVDRHHIISDASSRILFLEEIIRLYDGLPLPSLKLQYKDYSEWQNNGQQKELLKNAEEYWLKEFQGDIPLLNLPLDFPRPLIHNFEGNTIDFEISSQETERLKKIAAGEGATLFMILLALFNVFLAKICDQEDIIIGTPVVGRRHADLEKIMGIFINTLALRNYPKEEKVFREFLKEIKTRALNAFENQLYPFEQLVQKLGIKKNTSRNPLFDAMFSFHKREEKTQENEILQPGSSYLVIKHYPVEKMTTKFDLVLHGTEAANGMLFSFEYSTKLFKPLTVKKFISYFKEAITSVIKNPGARLWEIEVVSDSEEVRVLKAYQKDEEFLRLPIKDQESLDTTEAEFEF